MQIPLNFSNISFWLTITIIILLITLELTSPHYGQTNLQIDRKKLQNATIAVFVFFMISIAITTLNILLRP